MKTSRSRIRNCRRDRISPWNFVKSWSDDLFYRQLRMEREDFNTLCDKCKKNYPGRHEQGIRNYLYSLQQGSNSSIIPVTMEIKLCITLRLLAGASYLDMIWYGVSLESVHSIFISTLELINKVESNIKMPTTDDEWNDLSEEWKNVSIKKRGVDTLPGIVLAGDGIVFQIDEPTANECGNIPVSAFRNRKGYYALLMQAFCDAKTRFKFIEISWPGATGDLTAYLQTELFRLFESGKILYCVNALTARIY
jgi:hypothetical protein